MYTPGPIDTFDDVLRYVRSGAALPEIQGVDWNVPINGIPLGRCMVEGQMAGRAHNLAVHLALRSRAKITLITVSGQRCATQLNSCMHNILIDHGCYCDGPRPSKDFKDIAQYAQVQPSWQLDDHGHFGKLDSYLSLTRQFDVSGDDPKNRDPSMKLVLAEHSIPIRSRVSMHNAEGFQFANGQSIKIIPASKLKETRGITCDLWIDVDNLFQQSLELKKEHVLVKELLIPCLCSARLIQVYMIGLCPFDERAMALIRYWQNHPESVYGLHFKELSGFIGVTESMLKMQAELVFIKDLDDLYNDLFKDQT
jgi:hypothetical protein